MANDVAKRLLARIKQIREGLDLTQEVFAERAGLGYKYYQSVEAGRRRDIRLSTLEKLAKACGMELWELLNFEITPMLGEDPDKRGYHSLPGKGVRKPRKRKSKSDKP